MTKPGSKDPAEFRAAVDSMDKAVVHPGIELGPMRPPQRLAPYSYAISAEVKQPETDIIPEHAEGVSFGRLILLYDPSGDEAWNGTLRLVTLIQADVEAAVAVDPLLPEVVWSWLTDALEARSEPLHALGGTVTSTSSVRFGDMAGPPRVHQLELRASWTATTTDLAPHVEAFCEVLAYAAGLPPIGVTELGRQTGA
ncbi:MAG TPA: DUF3000 domain-containing protein [Aldersonia sp.]